jgi:hypothetical protein
MICDGVARSAKHRADPESPPPPRVSRGLKLRTGLRVYLIGHREVPADVFFDEPQSRPGVHVGFTSPRLWITSGLPTILELASLITTSAFLVTEPTRRIAVKLGNTTVDWKQRTLRFPRLVLATENNQVSHCALSPCFVRQGKRQVFFSWGEWILSSGAVEGRSFGVGCGFLSPSIFASWASTILVGRSLGRVQFLKRCGMTA